MAWIDNLVALNFYQDFVTISFSKKKKKEKDFEWSCGVHLC